MKYFDDKKMIALAISISLLGTMTACTSLSHPSEKDTYESFSESQSAESISEETTLSATQEEQIIEEVVETSDDSLANSSLDYVFNKYPLISENTMTEEEMLYFDDWIARDVNCGFALSQYADISYMNFDYIASEFDGGVDELNLTQQQIMDEFQKCYGSFPETDVTMYTTKAMNAYLMENANITMDDLRFAKEPDSETYDIYFSEHGDTNMVRLSCLGGYPYGEDGYTVTFTDQEGSIVCEMSFDKVEDRYVVSCNHLVQCLWNTIYGYDEDEFFLPHSNCSHVAEVELEGFTKEACRIARNEIYARYGVIFKDQSLNDHFSQFDWYEPLYSSEEFNYEDLSEIERENVTAIEAYEKKMGYR